MNEIAPPVAVEVDGVRLSTNASLGDPTGASTRNLSATNIESVEVVTGVPSAEYGDISSGVVKISTRKGKTPYTVTLSTNPRTKQIAASKGFVATCAAPRNLAPARSESTWRRGRGTVGSHSLGLGADRR